jgi:hypothetical protein
MNRRQRRKRRVKQPQINADTRRLRAKITVLFVFIRVYSRQKVSRADQEPTPPSLQLFADRRFYRGLEQFIGLAEKLPQIGLSHVIIQCRLILPVFIYNKRGIIFIRHMQDVINIALFLAGHRGKVSQLLFNKLFGIFFGLDEANQSYLICTHFSIALIVFELNVL